MSRPWVQSLVLKELGWRLNGRGSSCNMSVAHNPFSDTVYFHIYARFQM
jgi:hypothetical protein